MTAVQRSYRIGVSYTVWWRSCWKPMAHTDLTLFNSLFPHPGPLAVEEWDAAMVWASPMQLVEAAANYRQGIERRGCTRPGPIPAAWFVAPDGVWRDYLGAALV